MQTKYFRWILDMDDLSDDSDLMGEFNILGDRGEIDIGYTNIDVFFEIILSAKKGLSECTNYEVDPMIEPYRLKFNLDNASLSISYGSQQVVIRNKDDFFNDAILSIQKLTSFIESQPSLENSFLQHRENLKHCVFTFVDKKE